MSHVTKEFANQTTPQSYHFKPTEPLPREATQQVRLSLRKRGAVAYDMWLPETNYLPHLLHRNEHIMGSVFGRYNLTRDNSIGRGALVATDQRVLFLDKKPMFLQVDELSFPVIGGVTFSSVFIMGFVTLHTRLGDFRLRTFNIKNAANFVDYIETKCLQQTSENGSNFDSVT